MFFESDSFDTQSLLIRPRLIRGILNPFIIKLKKIKFDKNN